MCETSSSSWVGTSNRGRGAGAQGRRPRLGAAVGAAWCMGGPRAGAQGRRPRLGGCSRQRRRPNIPISQSPTRHLRRPVRQPLAAWHPPSRLIGRIECCAGYLRMRRQLGHEGATPHCPPENASVPPLGAYKITVLTSSDRRFSPTTSRNTTGSRPPHPAPPQIRRALAPSSKTLAVSPPCTALSRLPQSGALFPVWAVVIGRFGMGSSV